MTVGSQAVQNSDPVSSVADPKSAPDETPASSAGVVELQAKVNELEEGLLRSRADFQNLQRRAAAERLEAIRFANADLLKSLLGVLDDLERTVSSVERADDAKAVGEGVRLAHQNFLKVLRDHGVEPIEAAKRPFDPAVHNALLRQPTVEFQPGTVIEQVARGYRLKDRVLRPAAVIVAAPAPAEAEGAQPSRE
jgi:molecular chaperone GrpE